MKIKSKNSPLPEPNQKCSASTPWDWRWHWHKQSGGQSHRSSCESCRQRGPCCWWCCPPPARSPCTLRSLQAFLAAEALSHTWVKCKPWHKRLEWARLQIAQNYGQAIAIVIPITITVNLTSSPSDLDCFFILEHNHCWLSREGVRQQQEELEQADTWLGLLPLLSSLIIMISSQSNE